MTDQDVSVHAYNRGKAKGAAKERARIATQLRAEADRRRASDRDDMEPEIDTAVARALEDAADRVERGADDIRARQLPEGESIDAMYGVRGYIPGPRQVNLAENMENAGRAYMRAWGDAIGELRQLGHEATADELEGMMSEYTGTIPPLSKVRPATDAEHGG